MSENQPEWMEGLPSEAIEQIGVLQGRVETLSEKQARSVIVPPKDASDEERAEFDRKLSDQGYAKKEVAPATPDGYDVNVDVSSIPGGDDWKARQVIACHAAGMSSRQAKAHIERSATVMQQAINELRTEYGDKAEGAFEAMAKAQEKYGLAPNDKASMKMLIDMGMSMIEDSTRVPPGTVVSQDSIMDLEARQVELLEEMNKMGSHDPRQAKLNQEAAELAVKLQSARTGEPISQEDLDTAKRMASSGQVLMPA